MWLCCMSHVVGLLAGSLFQWQDLLKGNTMEVLVTICQACQSWKPLLDSWTTHSHWEHFDFPARLLGSPGLSLAPWRHEWPALSRSSRGSRVCRRYWREQVGPELSVSSRGEEAGGSTVEREHWGVGERDRWYSVGRCVCVCVCQCEFPLSDLYSYWQAVMGWLTTIEHIQRTHIWCLMLQWTGPGVGIFFLKWVASLRCLNLI